VWKPADIDFDLNLGAKEAHTSSSNRNRTSNQPTLFLYLSDEVDQ
jgi:hypothetical protein